MWDLLYYLVTFTFSLFCSQVIYSLCFTKLLCFHNRSDEIDSQKRRPIVISVDGNIGSGKSTLIKLLKEKYGEYIYFAAEPVDAWSSMSDESGNNLLHNFYNDKKRWSYSFQNIAYITRAKELHKAIESDRPIIITERSVMTDRNVFAKMLYKDGHMNRMEKTMYDTWFGLFNTKIDYTIYVKTAVENCVERIKKRAREGESDIEKEYLVALEKAHEDWLNGEDEWCMACSDLHEPGEIVILDGNPEDHSERISCVDKLIQQNLD